jgi:hypothetical protein
MKLAEFANQLEARAQKIGLKVRPDERLISDRFRQRPESDNLALPKSKLGFWYGNYPVILAPLTPVSHSDYSIQIKSLHAQVLIARSYVPPQHIVDMHLLLVFEGDLTAENAASIDRLERDEAICRKLVYVPGPAPETTMDPFLERTFLARPWDDKALGSKSFQLDQPADLVAEILETLGLSSAGAKAWVDIADRYLGGETKSPTQLVELLASAMEKQ